MRIATRSLLAALALLSAPFSADACEPIVPFVKAVGGPGLVSAAFVILCVVVLFKSAAFARFQTKLGFRTALLWMFAANVFTSLLGLVVPAMIDRGGFLLFLGVPLVWAVCLLPAQRLIGAAPATFGRFPPRYVASAITLVLIFSYLLLLIWRSVPDGGSFVRYWFFKVPALYVGLFVGVALTAFWEEWIVWRLSNSADDDTSFVPAIIRTNLIVLAAIGLISAAVVIPRGVRNLVNAKEAKVTTQKAK
jgi:hypothetical protein